MIAIIEISKDALPELRELRERYNGSMSTLAQIDLETIMRKLTSEAILGRLWPENGSDSEKPAEGVEAGKKAPEWEKDDYVWAVVKVCPKDDEKRKVVFARAKIENVVYVRNETRESRAVYTLTSPWGLLERENVFTTMQECEAFIDGFGFANIENAIR